MPSEWVRLDRAEHGFFGKIPARGDFVRSGLPTSFTGPWDTWMSGVLAASQPRLGQGWRDAWMQAPIWRFALAPGLCGPGGVVGLWMPSIDRAGRDYPLTIAAVVPAVAAPALAASAGAFLRAAVAAGLAALEEDLSPEALGTRVAAAASLGPEAVPEVGGLNGAALWWTDGSPLVPPTALAAAALPGADAFARMLDASSTEMVA